MPRAFQVVALLLIAGASAISTHDVAQAADVTAPAQGKFNIDSTVRTFNPPPPSFFDIDFTYDCGVVPSTLMQINYNEDGTVTGGCEGTWFTSPTPQYVHQDYVDATFSGTVDDQGLMTFRYEVYFTRTAVGLTGLPTARSITSNAVYEGLLQTSGTFVDFLGFVHGPAEMVDFSHDRTCTPGTSVEPGLTCQPEDTASYSGTVLAWTALKPSPPTVGVEIHHIELVQVVQDADNSVPLVAEKSTVARVFVTSDKESATGLVVTLRGRRGLQQLETPILINGGSNGAMKRGDFASTPNTYRSDKTKSFNFRLPESWLTVGAIEVEAEITSIDAPFVDSSPGNNTKVLGATFYARQRMSVEYLPICVTGPQPSCPDAGIATANSLVDTLFPVPSAGVRYKKANAPALEITALPASSAAFDAIQARLVKRHVLMEAFNPAAAPDQLAGWIQPNNSGDLGSSDPPFKNGKGHATINVYNPADPGDSSHTLAHEIAHNYSGRHPGTPDACNARDGQTDWPFTDARTHEIGWQFATNDVVPASKFELMSYCSVPVSNIWISKFTYMKLFDGFSTLKPQANGELNDVLVISGSALANGSVGTLDAILPLSTFADYQVSDPSGSHCIRFDAAPANDFCFDLSFTDVEGEPIVTAYFSHIVRIPPGYFSAASVSLLVNGTPIATLVRTPNAPVVDITSHGFGSLFNRIQTVTWTGSDLDANPLTYTILHSPDHTVSFTPILVDSTATSFTFDTTSLVGGGAGYLKIIASDGLNYTEDIAGPMVVGIARPWGDIRCDGAIDIADALAIRHESAGLAPNPPPAGCSAAGTLVSVYGESEALTWGDMTCDGEAAAGDALALLRTLAGLPVSPVSTCPAPADVVFASH